MFLLAVSISLFADVEAGKKVFAANCAICHTTNGGMALGPDMNLVAYAKDPSEHYKACGYSANAMPPFRSKISSSKMSPTTSAHFSLSRNG